MRELSNLEKACLHRTRVAHEAAGAQLVKTAEEVLLPGRIVHWDRRGYLQRGEVVRLIGTHVPEQVRVRVNNLRTNKVVDVRVVELWEAK